MWRSVTSPRTDKSVCATSFLVLARFRPVFETMWHRHSWVITYMTDRPIAGYGRTMPEIGGRADEQKVPGRLRSRTYHPAMGRFRRALRWSWALLLPFAEEVLRHACAGVLIEWSKAAVKQPWWRK